MKTLKFLDVTFESSCSKTPQFNSFALAYKKDIVDQAKQAGCELVSWSNGHFYCSAFFKNTTTGKLIYISCSDVRHFLKDWFTNILIRTAVHEKDYTGGSNNYSKLPDLAKAMKRLTA